MTAYISKKKRNYEKAEVLSFLLEKGGIRVGDNALAFGKLFSKK